MINAPDVSVCDGESLALALQEAQNKALAARQQATQYAAEAQKWERIAAELRTISDLARRPAIIKKEEGEVPANGERARRPYGFWKKAIHEALAEWGRTTSLGRGPTKAELRKLILQIVPNANDNLVSIEINKAINTGAVDYRIDHIYPKDR